MGNIKFFDLGIDRAVFRFYLMIAVTFLIGGLTEIWWLAAILAFAIAFSYIVGIRFERTDKKAGKEGKLVPFEEKPPLRRVA